jgi:hypothetical protein
MYDIDEMFDSEIASVHFQAEAMERSRNRERFPHLLTVAAIIYAGSERSSMDSAIEAAISLEGKLKKTLRL